MNKEGEKSTSVGSWLMRKELPTEAVAAATLIRRLLCIFCKDKKSRWRKNVPEFASPSSTTSDSVVATKNFIFFFSSDFLLGSNWEFAEAQKVLNTNGGGTRKDEDKNKDKMWRKVEIRWEVWRRTELEKSVEEHRMGTCEILSMRDCRLPLFKRDCSEEDERNGKPLFEDLLLS